MSNTFSHECKGLGLPRGYLEHTAQTMVVSKAHRVYGLRNVFDTGNPRFECSRCRPEKLEQQQQEGELLRSLRHASAGTRQF